MESSRELVVAKPASSGFTLIEVLTVLAVLGMLMLFIAPTFRTTLHRAKTAGYAQQVALLLQQARFEALKTGSAVSVAVAGNALVSTSGGERLASAVLPSRVSFEAARGFGGSGAVSFQTDGSVDAAGAFRIVDVWNNRLEIAVEPQATGRVEVRKRNLAGVYVTSGEGGQAWTFD